MSCLGRAARGKESDVPGRLMDSLQESTCIFFMHAKGCISRGRMADYEKGVQSFDSAGRIQLNGIFCHDGRG